MLVFVLSYFLFFKIVLSAQLVDLLYDKKKKKRRSDEAHSGPIQTSEEDFSVNIVKGF